MTTTDCKLTEQFDFETKRLENITALIRTLKVAQNAAVAGRWRCRFHDHSGDIARLQSHFFQALAHANLSPLPAPEMYRGSIRELYDSIEKFRTQFERLYGRIAGHSPMASTRCFLRKTVQEAASILEKDSFRLNALQRAHLSRQRKKSGLQL